MAFGTGISPSELGAQILQNCLAELSSLFPHLDGAFAALGCAPGGVGADIGTDGEAVRFSPPELLRRYLEDPAAVRRCYLHMLLHCLYLHPFADRRGSRWALAQDMAVEQVIHRAAVPRLALPPDPVRDACLDGLGDRACSAEEIYGMLERGRFPFSQEEMEAAFRFDSHDLWPREAGPRAAGARRWRGLAAGRSETELGAQGDV